MSLFVVYLVAYNLRLLCFIIADKFAPDFKAVYNVPNEKAGLEDAREKWGKKYPYAVSNWENNWGTYALSSSSLEKMLYLASLNLAKKWTQRYRNWNQVLNQLTVRYRERLAQYL